MTFRQSRLSTHRLSELQQSILRWLQAEGQRRRRTRRPEAIAYPELVRGLRADKIDVMIGLRHLMRKGLVSVLLPRGAWVRYVYLTEQGGSQAKSLSKEEPKHWLKPRDRSAADQEPNERRRRPARPPQRRKTRQSRRSST